MDLPERCLGMDAVLLVLQDGFMNKACSSNAPDTTSVMVHGIPPGPA